MTTADSSTESLEPQSEVQDLLQQARAGSAEAMGRLTEVCRRYLLTLADDRLPRDVRRQVAPSDIVQQTSLDMCRGMAAFRGDSRHALLAWARQILLNNVADTIRRLQRCSGRSFDREEPLTAAAPGPLADCRSSTPSAEISRREEFDQLGAAIDSLPGDYRAVVTLHHRECMAFADIAARMDRSVWAVRRLWARAVCTLRKSMTQHAAALDLHNAKQSDMAAGAQPDAVSLAWMERFFAAEWAMCSANGRAKLVGRVHRALGELSEADRELVLLRNCDEFSNDEAAELLGIPPAEAKTRYLRAIVRLRTSLDHS